jgi:hypothetical protein
MAYADPCVGWRTDFDPNTYALPLLNTQVVAHPFHSNTIRFPPHNMFEITVDANLLSQTFPVLRIRD